MLQRGVPSVGWRRPAPEEGRQGECSHFYVEKGSLGGSHVVYNCPAMCVCMCALQLAFLQLNISFRTGASFTTDTVLLYVKWQLKPRPSEIRTSCLKSSACFLFISTQLGSSASLCKEVEKILCLNEFTNWCRILSTPVECMYLSLVSAQVRDMEAFFRYRYNCRVSTAQLFE